MNIVALGPTPTSPRTGRTAGPPPLLLPSAKMACIMVIPGQTVTIHPAGENVLFYVLDGGGHMEMGGEAVELAPDTLIENPLDVTFALANRGKQTLRVMMLRLPRGGTALKEAFVPRALLT